MQLHNPPPNGFGASAYGPRGRQQAHGERWLGAGAPAQGSGRGSRAKGSASRCGPRLAGVSEPRRRATGDARESGPGFARNHLERFSRGRGVHGCASLWRPSGTRTTRRGETRRGAGLSAAARSAPAWGAICTASPGLHGELDGASQRGG